MPVVVIMPTPAERRYINGLAKAICRRPPAEIERAIAKNLAIDRNDYAKRGLPADAIEAHCRRFDAAVRAAIARMKYGPRPSNQPGGIA